VNAEDEQFGDQRLLSAVADARELGLQGSVESLIQNIVAWRGKEDLKDDVSILAASVQ
jgi:serine phosphatase RsbU (regulator of sigma subunit)